jgi:hypothetical protein
LIFGLNFVRHCKFLGGTVPQNSATPHPGFYHRGFAQGVGCPFNDSRVELNCRGKMWKESEPRLTFGPSIEKKNAA